MARSTPVSILMTLWVGLMAPSASWSADIAQFSLAGVRLGMSPDEPSERLPIVIEGKTFTPNPEGLWSLTEINKALPELTKPPAQWRGRERDYFERCANPFAFLRRTTTPSLRTLSPWQAYPTGTDLREAP